MPGALILPSRFNRQPQRSVALDQQNPFATGALHAYMGLEPFDVVSNSVFIPVGSPKRVAGGIEIATTNAALYRMASAKDKTNSFTVAFLVRSLGDSSPYAAIGGMTYDNIGSAPYGDQIDRGSNGRSLRFAFNTNGNAQATTEFGNLVVGVDEWLVATFTSGRQAFYRQSTGLVDEQFYTGTPAYTATSQVALGPPTNDGRNPNIVMRAARRWPRAFSQIEVNRFMGNPWQDAKSPTRRMWVGFSNGTSATAQPQGVFAAAVIGAPTAAGSANTNVLGQAASTSVGAPTGSGSAQTAPNGTAASAQTGLPLASGASTTSAAGVVASTAVGQPLGAGAAGIAVQGVAASAQVGSASANGGSLGVAAPAGVAAMAAVGIVLASGSARVSVAGVSVSALVGAVQGRAGGVANVLGLSATARVGQVVATATNPNTGEVTMAHVALNRIVIFEGSKRVVTFKGSTRIVRF